MKNTVLTMLLGLLLTGPGTGKADEATDSIAKPLENRVNGSEVDLEPYLKKTLPDLVAQIESKNTPDIIKRRAMDRIVSRYPKEAPDALVRFLYHERAHLNEHTGQLLFQLGRPNSKTDELVARIEAELDTGLRPEPRKQNPHWDAMRLLTLMQAVSWPGNETAIPVLHRTIDVTKSEFLTGEARLCLARIRDMEGPHKLLQLPDHGRILMDDCWYRRGFLYTSGDGRIVGYSYYVSQLLRAAADTRANDVLLKDGDPSPALALWDQKGIYALAWPGNKALADAYLKTLEPSNRFHVAAARTQDERCLKAIRSRFETAATRFLAVKRPRYDVRRSFDLILIAGVEAANVENAQTIEGLLKRIEAIRVAAEAHATAHLKMDPDNLQDWDCQEWDCDPAGFEREIILRGLCIHPNSGARTILEPYLKKNELQKNHELGYCVGLALLRAGNEEGLQCLLNQWSQSESSGGNTDTLIEAFLVYTAADIPYDVYKETVTKAKEWYQRHKGSEQLRNRIRAVNQSGLSDELVEPLKLWP